MFFREPHHFLSTKQPLAHGSLCELMKSAGNKCNEQFHLIVFVSQLLPFGSKKAVGAGIRLVTETALVDNVVGMSSILRSRRAPCLLLVRTCPKRPPLGSLEKRAVA